MLIYERDFGRWIEAKQPRHWATPPGVPGTTRLLPIPHGTPPTQAPAVGLRQRTGVPYVGSRTPAIAGVQDEIRGGEFGIRGFAGFVSPFRYSTPSFGLGGCRDCGPGGLGQITLPIIGAVGIGTLAIGGLALWWLLGRKGRRTERIKGARRRGTALRAKAAYEEAQAMA